MHLPCRDSLAHRLTFLLSICHSSELITKLSLIQISIDVLSWVHWTSPVINVTRSLHHTSLNQIVIPRFLTNLLQVSRIGDASHTFGVIDLSHVTRATLIECHLVQALAFATPEEDLLPLWVSSHAHCAF